MVRYLIRLDDFCPTNNLQKWEPFFELFDNFGIKPTIAVIPCNCDPKLLYCGNFNPNFWHLVRQLQKKGYFIGLHGYQHRYVTSSSGLLRINRRSEFAGLPLKIQEDKIKKAVAVFDREEIEASCFIAPAHSFDLNTLKALSKHSLIRTISDGLIDKPYKRLGFNWIPVQLSEPAIKKDGWWTINYHPETCSAEAFEQLAEFIKYHHKQIASPKEVQFKNLSFLGLMYNWMVVYFNWLRDYAGKELPWLKTLRNILSSRAVRTA